MKDHVVRIHEDRWQRVAMHYELTVARVRGRSVNHWKENF